MSESKTMMYEAAVPDPREDEDELLAEVVDLPTKDSQSFYQRNSGALPRAEAGLTDAHRRTQLPRPDNNDTISVKDRLLSLLNR